MLTEDLKQSLMERIAAAEDAREQAIDIMFELQKLYGYMTDEAMEEAGELLDMTPLELEELATFYNFIYREPVGKYVIHVCDSAVCMMYGHLKVVDYIGKKLRVPLGGMTADGLFSLLPVCCIGYCDRAPAMTVNGRVYGQLTPEKIDRVLNKLIREAEFLADTE